jgi:hypothetical protein
MDSRPRTESWQGQSSTGGSVPPPDTSPTRLFRIDASPRAAPSALLTTAFSRARSKTNHPSKAVKSDDFTAFFVCRQESIKPCEKMHGAGIHAPSLLLGLMLRRNLQCLEKRQSTWALLFPRFLGIFQYCWQNFTLFDIFQAGLREHHDHPHRTAHRAGSRRQGLLLVICLVGVARLRGMRRQLGRAPPPRPCRAALCRYDVRQRTPRCSGERL